MSKQRVIIMGAAGRDFHNFNTYFRDNEAYEVIAFTATQIPDIDGRKYPAELAGKLYPAGIPICAEADLVSLIKEHNVDQVVFAYSDVQHEYVMSKASIVHAAGADFRLLGPNKTQIGSKVPVIGVCAVRTGVGKSQTTRKVIKELKDMGLRVVAIRHPMPYGNLVAQTCQRFETYEDLDKHECTIEEREEYEPHIAAGVVVYAGVDYEKIIREAEKEADVILWDGGNNDFPFYKTDLLFTLVDPHRPGHELKYHPGETNLRLADVIIINKIDSASPEGIEAVRQNARMANPKAAIIDAASPIFVDDPAIIENKRVLVIEDGPTLTHGEMRYGAGFLAAQKAGASEIIDPRPYAVRSIAATYAKYTHVSQILPAMGYGGQQVKDLEETINAVDCDAVVIGTPIDLRRILKIEKPATRVQYELQEIGEPTIRTFLNKLNLKK